MLKRLKRGASFIQKSFIIKLILSSALLSRIIGIFYILLVKIYKIKKVLTYFNFYSYL